MAQLTTVLWKNYKLKRRRYVATVVEVAIPIVLFVLLAYVRTQQTPTDIMPTTYRAQSLPSAGIMLLSESLVCDGLYVDHTVTSPLGSLSSIWDGANITMDELHQLFTDISANVSSTAPITDCPPSGTVSSTVVQGLACLCNQVNLLVHPSSWNRLFSDHILTNYLDSEQFDWAMPLIAGHLMIAGLDLNTNDLATLCKLLHVLRQWYNIPAVHALIQGRDYSYPAVQAALCPTDGSQIDPPSPGASTGGNQLSPGHLNMLFSAILEGNLTFAPNYGEAMAIMGVLREELLNFKYLFDTFQCSYNVLASNIITCW